MKRKPTAREMRDSLDTKELSAIADQLALEALRDGFDFRQIAAIGALLAGLGAAASPEKARDPWMMLLAELADEHEQWARKRTENFDAELWLADHRHPEMEEELRRIFEGAPR